MAQDMPEPALAPEEKLALECVEEEVEAEDLSDQVIERLAELNQDLALLVDVFGTLDRERSQIRWLDASRLAHAVSIGKLPDAEPWKARLAPLHKYTPYPTTYRYATPGGRVPAPPEPGGVASDAASESTRRGMGAPCRTHKRSSAGWTSGWTSRPRRASTVHPASACRATHAARPPAASPPRAPPAYSGRGSGQGWRGAEGRELPAQARPPSGEKGPGAVGEDPRSHRRPIRLASHHRSACQTRTRWCSSR